MQSSKNSMIDKFAFNFWHSQLQHVQLTLAQSRHKNRINQFNHYSTLDLIHTLKNSTKKNSYRVYNNGLKNKLKTTLIKPSETT